jgi:leucyl-tRNA synthetase
MPRYLPANIEPKWQRIWEEKKLFKTPDMPAGDKLYVLDMFPYPSGDGLHVGHPEGYTATDIVCRFQRMRGKSVMHPMGFDAFGLPAEEHAIKTNTHPRETTEKNIATFVRQLKMLGFSYDWDRVLATTDKEYFRWTQWIFLVLYDTWFDAKTGKGRPISELPIPEEVRGKGEKAVSQCQDEHRLAYQADALVNWCPGLGTVLANEEVVDGKSERGGHSVQRMPLRQWMLRITAYADRLEKDLEGVDWPEGIRKLQRDWIGRSTGAEVDFYIGDVGAIDKWKVSRRASGFPEKPGEDVLRIYTTRPDTLFGATYMVIAPEHPFVAKLTTAAQKSDVDAYARKAASRSDRERQDDKKTKTGVFTGSYAINPVNGEKVPIWIADYVLISYGTGAIMAVPAHDERDQAFAKLYSLPIVEVVQAPESSESEECFSGDGTAINSGLLTGLPTAEAKKKITTELATTGTGKEAVNYKLRDWLFSRQRFWGEPFPILHEIDANGALTGVKRSMPIEQLPVDLPHLDDYKPHGRPEPPLMKAPKEWLEVTLDGKRYRRETNTMPQWAGSCWYYLRFIDPENSERFVDAAKEKAWMPIDLYVGGAEHAVLHLLYARFWHKVLFDRGYVSTPEPFRKLVNQGMILGEMEFTSYKDASGAYVTAQEVGEDEEGEPILKKGKTKVTPVKVEAAAVEKKGEGFVLSENPAIRVDSRAYKMSKSRGNVINPDAIVRDYGADSLRLYEMFMGPLEATKPWSMAGVSGVRGFLDRVWRLMIDDRVEEMVLLESVKDRAPTEEQLRVLHKTIFAVTRDTERMEFNTAIARMMEFTNFFTKESVRPKSVMETFLLLLAPYAPHIAEELWEALGHSEPLALYPWPKYDDALLRESEVEVAVQVKGKVRAKIRVPSGATEAAHEEIARADAKVAEFLAQAQVVKTIIVPGRLVNFVTK